MMEINGNSTTVLMHLLTWTELQRMRVNQIWNIRRMAAEQSVLLDSGNPNKPKKGKFDFYVETPSKTIGFEVLTRPSKGKMLQKLIYSKEVDEFVFVIPTHFLKPYQKENNHSFGWHVRHKKLPSPFSKKGLYVWLVNIGEQRIISKQSLSNIYYIENENGRKAS